MPKRSEAVAFVRQLCSLGLGGESVMPAVLDATRRAVRSEAATFFWVDKNYQISNAYFDRQMPPDLSRLYFEEFYNRRERDFGPGFSEAVRTTFGTGNLRRFMDGKFFRSDLYNVVWRPQGLHHSIESILRDGDRCLGVVQLFRESDDKPFGQADLLCLRQMVPYLRHGISAKSSKEVTFAESGDSGMLVTDVNGKLLHASFSGRRLLHLATHDPLSNATAANWGSELPEFARRLCTDLVATMRGRTAPPPFTRRHNRWGEFVLRAYPLEPLGPDAGPLLGISIEHHEPIQIALMRKLQTMPLSHRQREVCLLVARGCSRDEIARAMGVKSSTAIDHLRKIYTKLAVHGRDELLARLLKGGSGAGS